MCCIKTINNIQRKAARDKKRGKVTARNTENNKILSSFLISNYFKWQWIKLPDKRQNEWKRKKI